MISDIRLYRAYMNGDATITRVLPDGEKSRPDEVCFATITVHCDVVVGDPSEKPVEGVRDEEQPSVDGDQTEGVQ